jgi:PKD repeat protein
VRFSPPKLALALTLLLVSTQSVFAQNYPLPGKQGQAPVICTGCKDRNSTGQENDGLRTWPYAAPLAAHAGRYLDANFIANFQHPPRTLRSRRIRIARQQRGGAPPRAYIQLGSAIGVYSLDRFFSTTLPAGMVSVQTLASTAKRPGYTPEKVARWDSYVNPETEADWITPTADGQDRLFDFDFDDRGYVYVAAGFFGWGIVRDNGTTGGGQLSLVHQVLTDLPFCQTSDSRTCFPAIDDPRMIASFKSGGRYFAVVSDDTAKKGRRVWDVTDPTNPTSSSLKLGQAFALLSWAKDDARSRIAIVTGSRKVEIYDNSTLAAGGSALHTFTARAGKSYRDVTADENGNFWTTEATSSVSSNNLIKFERTASGYVERSFDVYGGPFAPEDSSTGGFNTIEYGDKYLAVIGHPSGGGLDARLFKVDSGEPVPVELNGFFRNYYWTPPRDYAKPSGSEVSYGLYPIKWNNKVYLLQSTNGIGDVFELVAGDSISVTQKTGTFGTVNPNAKPTESGPFYADIMKFRAESSNPLAAYTVLWNFDNPDSGSANEATARTAEDVEHQFTGLNTAAKINQARQVRANAPVSTDLTDAVTVTLKVPTARIGVGGTNTVVTADASSLEIVAGDVLTDASDGTVESHYATWTVNGTPVKKKPDQTVAADEVGPHTVTLAASYGKYDAGFNTVGLPYVDTVSSVTYVARPFIVAFSNPSTTTTAVTFKGAARKTSLTSVLSAANWTVDWTLKSPGGADVAPALSLTVPVGQIPNFPVADKASIPSGSILKLKVSVDPSGLSAAAAQYASHEVTQTLITPDPKITKLGCANANESCTFTGSSIAGNPIGDWTMTWTLKKSGVQVGSPFVGNPFKPTLTDAGSYSVSMTASTTVFAGNAALPDFPVAAPVCTNPPTAEQMSIFASCTSGCATNVDITLAGDPWLYIPEDCEEYMWTFGDGTTATTNTRTTKHKYTTNGTKTVRLKVKKGSQTSPEFTKTIVVGSSDQPPPPPPCGVPTGINFTYVGNKGCAPGTNCKVGESVKFTGLRAGGAGLANCDTATWTFHDATTPVKSPSKTYTATGTFDVQLVISNESGTSTPVTKTLTIVADDTVSNCIAPNEANISVSFRGRQSSCTATSSQRCTAGEIIDFRAELFPLNNPQSCDRFDWNFGDQSAVVTSQNASKTFATNGTYHVTMKFYNTAGPTGVTLPLTVVVGNTTETKPIPELSFVGFPTTGTKGVPVTFTVNANRSATGWAWDFGDGQKDSTSQASIIGTSTSIQHTYNSNGTFTVSVKARNSEDVASAQTGTALGLPGIVITDIPEYKFLLPVVTHGPGQNNSVWRTDVQIYSSQPNISPQNPLRMTATMRDISRSLEVFNPTFTYHDFMTVFTNANDSGPVIITVRAAAAPQIWTRTYNQTQDGTFGQFIPAVRIDAAAGSGNAFGAGKYYMAGLRHDARFRTNLGFVNPNAQTINATVKVFDDRQLQVGQFTLQLPPFQLDQFPITADKAVKNLSPDRPFSLQIEVPAGQWLIGYASFIDSASNDPVYVQAVRESELSIAEYRQGVVPGVGHVGEWRSDVTIFNPDSQSVVVDLAYHNEAGVKMAEAKNVLIRSSEFLQFTDLLKQGILGNVPDSIGILRVTVPDSVPVTKFPLTFARTYNDKGIGKTFGQGIGGFAAGRANVKPGKPALVPGVRSSTEYYTNVFVMNPSNVAVVATVKVLDPTTGAESTIHQFTLQPNETRVGPVNLGQLQTASLQIEVTGGNAWAFCSIVDRGTLDPEYVPATPLAQ